MTIEIPVLQGPIACSGPQNPRGPFYESGTTFGKPVTSSVEKKTKVEYLQSFYQIVSQGFLI